MAPPNNQYITRDEVDPRHLGIQTEGVHQFLEPGDLGNDGLAARGEDLSHFAIEMICTALDPLGRKPDGGERVLDLMGDTLCDLAPGRLALGLEQLGEVVEGNHLATARQSGGPHFERLDRAVRIDVHLPACVPRLARAETFKQALKARAIEFVDSEPRTGPPGHSENLGGGGVWAEVAARAVHGQDTGGNGSEQRRQFLVGGENLRPCGPNSANHGVERVDEDPDLVGGWDIDLLELIALGNPLGGGGHRQQRLGETS